jgi:hypothetical protein
MALPRALQNFCHSWQAKAEAYSADDLSGAFDRFFTSYVVFNRFYAEATYRLARRGQVKLRERFPDAQAAQEYVVQYCGAERLVTAWEGSPETTAALREIADYLRARTFALRLDPTTGDIRPEEDHKLLVALESHSRDRRAKAVLEALYAIRCNMFHGQKEFDIAQVALLRPAICVLEGTIRVLYDALDRSDN